MTENYTDRAAYLLQYVRFAAMATVNEDGTPHNTPYFFIIGDDYARLYWGSHEDSLHSKNIVRTGQVFVVLYDSDDPTPGGVYITAQNAHMLKGDELERGLDVHNRRRAKYGKDPIPIEYYLTNENSQRMYAADITNIEVSVSKRDHGGHILSEHRQKIIL